MYLRAVSCQCADAASMLAIRLAEDALAFKLTKNNGTVLQSVTLSDAEITQ